MSRPKLQDGGMSLPATMSTCNLLGRFARHLEKSHKNANRVGRKSGRIDSIRPLCSRFDLLESRFARHLEKITQKGEQGG